MHDYPQTQTAVLSSVLTPAQEQGVLILCDVDGVMIEPEPEAHIAAHLDTARDVFGIEVPREKFWDACENGLTDRCIAQQLVKYAGQDANNVAGALVERWRLRIGELFQIYTALSEYKPLGMPHVADGLMRAQSIPKVQLAIATGNVERIARAKLESTGLADFFPLDGGGFGDFTLKRVDLLKDALKTSGWPVEDTAVGIAARKRVYLLGDTVHDMQGALELGIHPIGVATGGHGRAELKAAGAEAVFLRFDRAIEFILSQSDGLWTATIDPLG